MTSSSQQREARGEVKKEDESWEGEISASKRNRDSRAYKDSKENVALGSTKRSTRIRGSSREV